MWEAYKQRGIRKFKEDIGDRSGFGIFHFYACIFIGVLGLLSAAFIVLILAAWLPVYFHWIPAQEAGEIAGNIFLGSLFVALAFFCTKSGNQFLTQIGKRLEKSILQGFHALRVLPVLSSPQDIKYLHADEAPDCSDSSTPYIPPRSNLA